MRIRKISEDFDSLKSTLSEVDDELNNIEKKFKNIGFACEFKHRIEQNGLHVYFFDSDYAESDKTISLMNDINNMVLNISRSFDISEFSISMKSEKINWKEISDEPIPCCIDGRLILK